jgi:DNA modification methylase
MRPEVIQGDVREVLKTLDDESVQCVVTSPPYWGLRDYGVDDQIGLETTPEKYVENMVVVFREVKRVLRKEGTLWLNLGDSYASAKSRYSSGPQTIAKGKSHDEPMGGKKPDLYYHPVLKDKDLVGIPWRVALALQADGWYIRSDIIWNKPNPMPESVRDRPTKSHEYIFLLTKSARYYYDSEAVMERKRNRRSVWDMGVKPYKEAHFATFPEQLPETCIKAGTKKGDVVLDIFAGSGTTLRVASKLGRKGIGIELNPEYVKILRKRCRIDTMSLDTFISTGN